MSSNVLVLLATEIWSFGFEEVSETHFVFVLGQFLAELWHFCDFGKNHCKYKKWEKLKIAI